jgi:23S rRNA (adenine2030-N6)-methyltransferase
MNYRHIYHAGNFADVVKHAAVAMLVRHMAEKDKPFFVLDTHAGCGRYDLASAEAEKTGESAAGIGRLWAAPKVPEELEAYLSVVKALNGGESLRWYPGSPLLIRKLLRSCDRMAACELHPADAAKLKAEFRRDRQVAVYQLDGYLALKSLLPPAERRGLVLVDPPFEAEDEFDRLAKGLRQACRRWATGTYVLWYPVKDVAASKDFLETLRASGIRRVLGAELWVEKPGDKELLTGCGLVFVNPPWTLPDALAATLPFLARVLARRPGAGFKVSWLAPEWARANFPPGRENPAQ